jgi:hypothetical protein
MLRHAIGLLDRHILKIQTVAIRHARGFSKSVGLGYEDRPLEYAAAREWASSLKKDAIPRSIAKVQYSRSSGAGGQHVNK